MFVPSNPDSIPKAAVQFLGDDLLLISPIYTTEKIPINVFNVRSFYVVDLVLMNHKVVNCVTQHVICNLFSISFNFCLQLLHRVWVGVVYTIFEVDPSKIITGIHVQ